MQKLPALDWLRISNIFKLVISACEIFAMFSQQLTIALIDGKHISLSGLLGETGQQLTG